MFGFTFIIPIVQLCSVLGRAMQIQLVGATALAETTFSNQQNFGNRRGSAGNFGGQRRSASYMGMVGGGAESCGTVIYTILLKINCMWNICINTLKHLLFSFRGNKFGGGRTSRQNTGRGGRDGRGGRGGRTRSTLSAEELDKQLDDYKVGVWVGVLAKTYIKSLLNRIAQTIYFYNILIWVISVFQQTDILRTSNRLYKVIFKSYGMSP